MRTRKSHKGLRCEKRQGFIHYLAIKSLRKILNEISIKFQKGAEKLSEPHTTDSDSYLILNFLRMADASLREAEERCGSYRDASVSSLVVRTR